MQRGWQCGGERIHKVVVAVVVATDDVVAQIILQNLAILLLRLQLCIRLAQLNLIGLDLEVQVFQVSDLVLALN